jgi:hypothetical protein
LYTTEGADDGVEIRRMIFDECRNEIEYRTDKNLNKAKRCHEKIKTYEQVLARKVSFLLYYIVSTVLNSYIESRKRAKQSKPNRRGEQGNKTNDNFLPGLEIMTEKNPKATYVLSTIDEQKFNSDGETSSARIKSLTSSTKKLFYKYHGKRVTPSHIEKQIDHP